MHLSENEGIEGRRFAVTGGLGFVGAALCLELCRRGAAQVVSLDSRASSPFSADLLHAGVRCIQGDVRNKKDVEKALRGMDCVFHLSSFGMSGKELIQAGKVHEVNINGTCNVLDTCVALGVKRLVYVSTYNVVFGGKEIINGNEALPYFPIDDQSDAYGRSKAVAEQLVLRSNGRPLEGENGGRLYTCAIRPAAIYGPREERHLPRMISLAKMGLTFFRIGGPSVKTDWVYVDNLILALLLASMGLLDDIPGRGKKPVAAGQAYFICDGSPVNTFDFLAKPLFQSLNYTVPNIVLDVPVALFISEIFLYLYIFLYPWISKRWIPQPLLLPAEVRKIGVTHYFSILKARQELGYVPLVSPQEGLAATISYWKEKKRHELDGPTIFVWFLVLLGLFMVFAGGFLPPLGPLRWVQSICLFFFRSIWLTRLIFVLSALLHVGEAVYAWFLARKVDPRNSIGWFWQTFCLGFFSLQYLLKRSRK